MTDRPPSFFLFVEISGYVNFKRRAYSNVLGGEVRLSYAYLLISDLQNSNKQLFESLFWDNE
jgi:hypothetical protein